MTFAVFDREVCFDEKPREPQLADQVADVLFEPATVDEKSRFLIGESDLAAVNREKIAFHKSVCQGGECRIAIEVPAVRAKGFPG